jgi:deferrochelatase/peroxidase EfeB
MTLNLSDIQGNILRGYGMANARHFFLQVQDPGGARRFVALIAPGGPEDTPHVTTADTWDERPPYCLNVGFTHEGLAAIGVPAPILTEFPPAFQEGAAQRSQQRADEAGIGLGDVGDGAPEHWVVGGTATPPTHLIVSLFTDEERDRQLDRLSATLRERFGQCGLVEVFHQDANALPDGRVHFGYIDGLSQPRVKGAPGVLGPDMQPEADTGDFLLGCGYRNLYGGNFLGSLPSALGDNATYGALRIISQDVAAFERFLDESAQRHNIDREFVAAKLMGRWRQSGAPLVLSPDTDTPVPGEDLNYYDYAPGPGHQAYFDDAEGLRCPIGAHVRRLNPRGALVMGQPHSRRLIRRGMPYGPHFAPDAPDNGIERGLVGYFVCGDLALQFEFILRTWANLDFSTYGIRGTREPIVGWQPPFGGTFTIRTGDTRDPIVLTDLPRLTVTRGSLYCFLPGIGGLDYLASLGAGEAAA